MFLNMLLLAFSFTDKEYLTSKRKVLYNEIVKMVKNSNNNFKRKKLLSL